MTIVYSTAFEASVDTNLNAYPSGTPDWYLVRVVSANDIRVMAATDRVESIVGGQVDFGCGLIHARIGSINDYAVQAKVRRASDLDMGMLGARCGGAFSSNYYFVGSDSSNNLVLYRGNGGGAAPIKTTAAAIPTNAILTARLTVSGTNPVILNYSIGNASDTFSDPPGSSHTSGPPGVFFARVTAGQPDVWLGDFQISNDLSGADFATPSGSGGADPSGDVAFEGHLLDYMEHLAYMRGGKKRKRKPHFMVESEIQESFGR